MSDPVRDEDIIGMDDTVESSPQERLWVICLPVAILTFVVIGLGLITALLSGRSIPAEVVVVAIALGFMGAACAFIGLMLLLESLFAQMAHRDVLAKQDLIEVLLSRLHLELSVDLAGRLVSKISTRGEIADAVFARFTPERLAALSQQVSSYIKEQEAHTRRLQEQANNIASQLFAPHFTEDGGVEIVPGYRFTEGEIRAAIAFVDPEQFCDDSDCAEVVLDNLYLWSDEDPPTRLGDLTRKAEPAIEEDVPGLFLHVLKALLERRKEFVQKQLETLPSDEKIAVLEALLRESAGEYDAAEQRRTDAGESGQEERATYEKARTAFESIAGMAKDDPDVAPLLARKQEQLEKAEADLAPFTAEIEAATAALSAAKANYIEAKVAYDTAVASRNDISWQQGPVLTPPLWGIEDPNKPDQFQPGYTPNKVQEEIREGKIVATTKATRCYHDGDAWHPFGLWQDISLFGSFRDAFPKRREMLPPPSPEYVTEVNRL